MRRIAFLTSLLVLTLILAACGGGSGSQPAPAGQAGQAVQAPAQVTKIDAGQLATMLDDKDFTFVNVHIPYAGEIANTDLFVPFDEIQANLDKLPDKDAKIVVYCRSGSMSDMASTELAGLGYTDVYDVVGGMGAWAAAGHELLDLPQ